MSHAPRLPARSAGLLGLWLLAPACQSAAAPTRGGNQTLGVLARFAPDSLPFSYYSEFREPTFLEITDRQAFDRIWQANNRRGLPTPSVDFTRERVVLVAMGEEPGGGFGVRFTGAQIDSDLVRLVASESAPGATCVTTPALTQPIDLAGLPRGTERLALEVTRTVQSCGP